MERLEREALATQRKLENEIEKVRRSYRAELVPYVGARRQDLVPARVHAAGVRRFKVPIKVPIARPSGDGGSPTARS
jgi:hypothetical protein